MNMVPVLFKYGRIYLVDCEVVDLTSPTNGRRAWQNKDTTCGRLAFLFLLKNGKHQVWNNIYSGTEK